ncbi:hypothetical protein AGMMS50293_29410 [Spirochaetia bacterium]|nr:hypothetical protein AGMMS50293_29410 [Spirochaetia bacterium]
MNKSKFFILGMLALTLTFGLVLAGCGNGTSSGLGGGADASRFYGSWEGDSEQHIHADDYDGYLRVFVSSRTGSIVGGVVSTLTETTLNISTYTVTYVFNSATELVLSGGPTDSWGFINGTYTKQAD